ncbi:hypothetical protein [Streptomyces lydicus]|uniref:hypothetical protein n=1 Tax=Streptomyces lydicus TaxID=47763 RepID=UPI00332A193A
MADLALTVEIDGQQHPLRDCFWILASPTGCVYSSTHGDTAVDAETAHQLFTRLKRDRDREARQGWTVQLLTPAQWDEQAKPCLLVKCQHRQPAAGNGGAS